MEAEYESRITKMETSVKDKLVQQQAVMNEILSKVDYCEKKVKS